MAERQLKSTKIEHALDDVIAWVRQHEDITNRAFAAMWASGECQRVIAELGEIRTDVTRQLHEQGYSYRELADMFGVSRSRIQQLIEGDRRPAQAAAGAERYRARCKAPTKSGDQCTRGAVYMGSNGKVVCGTHATWLLNQGVSIEEYKP